MTRAPLRHHRHYMHWGKRALDLLVSSLVLILLAPILVIVALLVRLTTDGPVFFIQQRIGRNGTLFEVYKFRTMTHQPRVPNREIIGCDIEVTSVGYWLRRFKIDELPQLLNVLKGNMSIVGPRPGLPSQLPDFDENGNKRLFVRPGLTGLAQVNGNILLSWPDRWRYDAQYVDNLSLRLDLQIVYRTLAVVILGESRFYKPPEGQQKVKGVDGNSNEI